MLETMEIMQDPLFDRRIAAHGERKSAAGLGNTPSPLQKRLSEGIGFGEFPKGGPFFGCSSGSIMRDHMELPKQIMREDGGHHVKVIAMKPSYGDVIQIALGFQFAERIFLRPATVVKMQDFLHRGLLVGNDHFELIAVFMGNEEIELDGLLRLLPDYPSDKKETETTVPTLGFPGRVEIRKLTVEEPQAPSTLNHLLELGETLKRHGDCKFNAFLLERPDNIITEKCAVHAHLNGNPGTGASYSMDALQDEFKSAVTVMHIARTREHIEDLPRLRYHTEQRIIAPLSLLLFVKSYCRALGLSAGAQYRSVKIERQPKQPKTLKSCNQHLPAHLPELADALVIDAGQRPADGRNIRKFSQAQQTQHHKVVPIVVHIPKSPISQHQVHNQGEDNNVMAEYRVHRYVIETTTKTGFQVQSRKQFLNDNQTCKRSKPLILKTKLRHFVDTGENLCFTRFHFQWPPVLVDFASRKFNFNQSGGLFSRP